MDQTKETTADQSKETNRRSWGGKIAISATVVSALATLTIAWVYFSQLGVMQDTLNALEESNRVGQMTILQLCVDSTCTSANVKVTVTEEGGHRWHLPYYVKNISDYPAFGIEYYHGLCTLDSIPIPNDSRFVRRYETSVVLPGQSLNCGWDEILKQQVIDTLKTGKSLYRHFIVKYTDAFRNEYMYYAIFTVPDPMGDSIQTVGAIRYDVIY